MTQRRSRSPQVVWRTPNFWLAEYHVAHQPIQEGATLLARKTGAWGQKLQQDGQWECHSSKLAHLRRIQSSLGSRKHKVLYIWTAQSNLTGIPQRDQSLTWDSTGSSASPCQFLPLGGSQWGWKWAMFPSWCYHSRGFVEMWGVFLVVIKVWLGAQLIFNVWGQGCEAHCHVRGSCP